VLSIWVEACNEAGVEDLERIPKNLDNIGYFLVNHTRVVARLCKEAAVVVEELHNINVDMDILVAGALLHDVSKVMEIRAEGDDFQASEFGKRIQHGFYAAYKAYEKRLPLDLQHMLIAHTPKSNVVPQTLEGVILYHIDTMDTDVLNQSLGVPLMLKK
jgi:putative nucleotidyltransferase with HDIG domain